MSTIDQELIEYLIERAEEDLVKDDHSRSDHWTHLTDVSSAEFSTTTATTTDGPCLKPMVSNAHTIGAGTTAANMVLDMLFAEEDTESRVDAPVLNREATIDMGGGDDNKVKASVGTARVAGINTSSTDAPSDGEEDINAKTAAGVSMGDSFAEANAVGEKQGKLGVSDEAFSFAGDGGTKAKEDGWPEEHELGQQSSEDLEELTHENIFDLVERIESEVKPTTFAPSVNIRPLSQPGAFAVAGINQRDSSDSQDVEEPLDFSGSGEFDIEANAPMFQPNNTNLAVAEKVNETDQSFPRAEELDLKGTESQTEEKIGRRRLYYRYRLGGFGIVLMAVVLVVILTVLLRPKEKVWKQSPQENTTMVPTPEATLSPEDYLLSIVPKATARSIRSGVSNAQKESFDWMLADPSLQNYTEERLLQRFALSTLYYRTSSEKPWVHDDHWLSYDVHECDWYNYHTHGFYGFPESETDSLYNVANDTAPCNEEGIYEHLWLVHNNLQGRLPKELYLLTSLKSLSFDRNELQGTLSSQVGLLTNLEALALYNNGMDGTLPTELGRLTKLEYFWAMTNQWTGPLPSEVGLLSNTLIYLLLDTCELSGPIPTEVGRLTTLEWFWLYGNHLTGSLPSELGLMQNLTSVAIDFNEFTGSIPTEVGKLTKVETLHIEANFITGTLPSELIQLTNLSSFVFPNTLITGSIPSELGLLTSLTRKLWCWEGLLTGSLPTELGMLSGLAALEFSYNDLTGTIPTELGNLHHAWMIRLSNNRLTGTLPSEVGLIQDLWTFWVQGNHLTGPIPSELGAVESTLEYWDDSQNSTVEYYPLVELLLDNNLFTGQVPSELGLLTSLTSLSIHNNSALTGQVPESFCGLKDEAEEELFISVDCELVQCNCSVCSCLWH
jgi:Leucine-rich repeat (LRR) protein